MNTRWSVGVVAASLVLGPLGSSGSGSVSAADRAQGEACTKRRTERLVRAFIASYNGGDLDRADGAWAQEPDFQWYFVDDEREGSMAEDRRTLPVYLAERARLGDRLRLLSLSISRDGTDFSFELRRRTNDPRLGSAGRFHGKGSAGPTALLPTTDRPLPARGCALTVWSMDTDV